MIKWIRTTTRWPGSVVLRARHAGHETRIHEPCVNRCAVVSEGCESNTLDLIAMLTAAPNMLTSASTAGQHRLGARALRPGRTVVHQRKEAVAKQPADDRDRATKRASIARSLTSLEPSSPSSKGPAGRCSLEAPPSPVGRCSLEGAPLEGASGAMLPTAAARRCQPRGQ